MMQATNVAHSAALGYGLGVARAVGRMASSLRAAQRYVSSNTLPNIPVLIGESSDVRKLERAGLITVARSGRTMMSFSLTGEGEKLAARL